MSEQFESKLKNKLEQIDKDARLKPYLHFTLLCTLDNKSVEIKKLLPQLSSLLRDVSFTAESVVNFGEDEKSLWAVKLSFGEKEKEIRKKLSELLDQFMTKERNGVLYQWSPSCDRDAQLKTPHITLGKGKADFELGEELVKNKSVIKFGSIDLKETGPSGPITSFPLSQSKVTSTADYQGMIFNSNNQSKENSDIDIASSGSTPKLN